MLTDMCRDGMMSVISFKVPQQRRQKKMGVGKIDKAMWQNFDSCRIWVMILGYKFIVLLSGIYTYIPFSHTQVVAYFIFCSLPFKKHLIL